MARALWFIRPIGLVWLIERLADLGVLADSVDLAHSDNLGTLSVAAGSFARLVDFVIWMIDVIDLADSLQSVLIDFADLDSIVGTVGLVDLPFALSGRTVRYTGYREIHTYAEVAPKIPTSLIHLAELVDLADAPDYVDLVGLSGPGALIHSANWFSLAD